ncbi:MAG: hypothetical protein GX757_05495 [Clostridiales bacterium]|nr:hypothetical protein [Clostridiales bacterium]
MNCNCFQSMIVPFINDELTIKELEPFLDHVTGCQNCMEELEIYYTLLTAMRQLDEDKSLSGDYKRELMHRLEAAQERIVHAKYTYYRKKAILILVIAVIAFLLNFRYTSDLSDDYIDINPEISDFHIRRAFKSVGNSELESLLEDYIDRGMENDVSGIPEPENAR